MAESRTTRSNVPGALAAGLIVTLFCFVLLWHDPLVFWNDDYELSILPVFADVARSWGEGHLPLLSPYSWVCSNLAGEFQYGTFSIFINAAVVLIWKFPLTFPQQAAALSITHLFVLAMGAFLLARGRNLSFPLSIFVALVASLNGWIVCWGATDWFGALGAFAWLPWAWWALEKSLAGMDLRTISSSSHRKRLMVATLLPAPFVYLVITGGFPYTVVMLALLIIWLSIKFATANPSDGGSLVQTKSLMSILPMLIGVALGFGLSAPAWLAIFDYVQGSAREVQTSSTHWQWIVPWRALPGLILPCWTVNWADFGTRLTPHTGAELACGLVAPAALLAAFISRGRAFVRQNGWDLILLLLVLLLSMLPTAGLFRWSFRWLPLFHLALGLCAAHALQDRPRYGLVALLLVGLTTVAMSILQTTGHSAFPLIWIFLGLCAVWIVAEWLLGQHDSGRWIPAALTFAAFLATYFCLPTNCGVPKYNLSQELVNPAPLDPERLYLSIYSWAEITYRVESKPSPIGQVARPGSISMWAGLRFINGYSPILAAGVAREFKCTTHGEIGWGVDRDLLEHQAGPDGELAKLGVDGIVVAREINFDPQPSAEWDLVLRNDEGRVFHRRGAPFAHVRSETAILSRIDDSRNRVEVNVDVPSGDKPALLEFSRPFFRGYVARLGHARWRVDSYRGLIPIVEVPAGSHGRLILSYRPDWLLFGGIVSLFCLSILGVGGALAIFPRE